MTLYINIVIIKARTKRDVQTEVVRIIPENALVLKRKCGATEGSLANDISISDLNLN